MNKSNKLLRRFNKLKKTIPICLASIVFLSAGNAQAEIDPAKIGQLIWSDEFNTFQSNVWSHEIGDGCAAGNCAWGNNERQYYAAENTSIEPTPGDADPTNKSLVIEAREEKRGSREYTSARIISKDKVAVHYGMLEVRIQVPDLDHGLWPAAWLLGDSTLGWPRQGEIDIMEMGHRADDREFNHCEQATTNQFTGANVFHYHPLACNPQNATCAANFAWRAKKEDYSNVTPYCSGGDLHNKFVIYRMYWTPEQIDITVDDGLGEHTLFTNPFNINPTMPDLAVFNQPFYLLLNMAVGGNLPGLSIWEPQNPVTALEPGERAKMYVDYVRLYEYDGHGSVKFGSGPPTDPLTGSIGLVTDRTNMAHTVAPGNGANLWVWGETLVQGPAVTAFEGSNAISWLTDPAKGWFGAGLQANQKQNLNNYAGGTLNFAIQVPADLSFKIGIIGDSGENYVTFPANENVYGLDRSAAVSGWGQVSIPIHTLRGGGAVNLSSVTNLFAILSGEGAFPAAPVKIAIDDIHWLPTGGTDVTDSDGDGVIDSEDQCAGTAVGTRVANDGCAVEPETGVFGVYSDTGYTNNFLDGTNSDVWVWEQTLLEGPARSSAEGENVISWISVPAKGWFGAGVDSRRPLDLSNHLEGALKFKINLPANVGFEVGVIDAQGKESWVKFPANENVYGLDRNLAATGYGQASIPVHYLLIPGTSGYTVDPTSIDYAFAIRSDSSAPTPPEFTMALDDIVWDNTGGVSVVDSDNDGVIDVDDECPSTPPSTRVSNKGCTVVAHLGTFGVATERSVDAGLNGDNSDTWIWEKSLNPCTSQPVEGSSAICWQTKPNSWFGGGIESRETLDLSNFDQGSLKLQVRAPASLEFRIGLIDSFGNESWLRFPANQAKPQYNFHRTGDWEEVTIPMSDLRGFGLVKLESLKYPFTVLNGSAALPTGALNLEFDDIRYVGGVLTDSDGDGVNDTNDQCPNTVAGATVDGKGCSSDQNSTTDSDNDGVNDTDDLCPNTAAGVVVNAQGCAIETPLDSDNDGVNDTDDLCPNTAAGVLVNAQGCAVETPLDSDNDGVSDTDDLCPNTAAGVVVNAQGCAIETPLDSDNDGVNDTDDQCPNTVAGAAVDGLGCSDDQNELPTFSKGVNATGGQVEFFIKPVGWSDIHYKLNGGGQQNIRMTNGANNMATYSLMNLSAGDVLEYYYTYWDLDCSCQRVTEHSSHTVSGNGDDTVQDPDLTVPEIVISWPTPAVHMDRNVQVAFYGGFLINEPVAFNIMDASLTATIRHIGTGSYLLADGSWSATPGTGNQLHHGQVVAADGHWRVMHTPTASGTYEVVVTSTAPEGSVTTDSTTYIVR